MAMNTYTDPFVYQRAATGFDTSGLVGVLTRLTGGISLGATSLPVPSLASALPTAERITIFDGPLSEAVTLTAPASIGATSLSVTATLAAHANQTPLCSDGPDGSLADLIVQASANIESICLQPLYQATYTNEKLRLPSMRAAISEADHELVFRTRQFPVTQITALSLVSSGSETSYEIAGIHLDSSGQTAILAGFARHPCSGSLTLKLTYQAGYSVADLPGDIKDAATLLVSELLTRKKNPMGAVEYQLGKRRFKFAEGRESQLVCSAKEKLRDYSVKAF